MVQSTQLISCLLLYMQSHRRTKLYCTIAILCCISSASLTHLSKSVPVGGCLKKSLRLLALKSTTAKGWCSSQHTQHDSFTSSINFLDPTFKRASDLRFMGVGIHLPFGRLHTTQVPQKFLKHNNVAHTPLFNSEILVWESYPWYHLGTRNKTNLDLQPFSSVISHKVDFVQELFGSRAHVHSIGISHVSANSKEKKTVQWGDHIFLC